MSESQRFMIKALAIAVALIAAQIYWTWPAYSHDWYSYECCNDRDCRPLLESEYTVTAEGYYIIPAAILIPFGDSRIKVSADQDVHACFISNVPAYGIRCLYVPAGA